MAHGNKTKGPCFSSKKCQEFSAISLQICHFMSRTCLVKAEKGVHILKQPLTASLMLTLLCLITRTSLLECGMVPDEILMNRKLCTILLSCSEQKVSVKIKQKLKQLRDRQKFCMTGLQSIYNHWWGMMLSEEGHSYARSKSRTLCYENRWQTNLQMEQMWSVKD